MNVISKLGLLSLSAALAVACGEAPPAKTTPAPAAQAPAPAAAAPVATAAEFGVPECDEYMTKYLTCIDSKVPEAARASVRQGLEQTKASWKQIATTPEGKSGLAMACKQATDAARTAMTAYGCTF